MTQAVHSMLRVRLVFWMPWIGRSVLTLAVLIFGRVGWHYIVSPLEYAALYDFTLNSPGAITNLRVGIGAFHLGTAAIALVCIAPNRHMIFGLAAVTIMTGVVVATHLLGVVLDGPDPKSLHVLHYEESALMVFVLGLLAEWTRVRRFRGGVSI